MSLPGKNKSKMKNLKQIVLHVYVTVAKDESNLTPSATESIIEP